MDESTITAQRFLRPTLLGAWAVETFAAKSPLREDSFW